MKKKITVRYFALFREHAGISGETLESDADDAASLFEQLKHRHGSAEPSAHCKVAINDEMADWDSPLSDGDVVLLFPPVAGG
ncbi:MAG: MoaD/ThiS family protein [Gammaproteobacteria bacterium]|nr:MoaD/ThiS family protein [Gammaproteobacteria bacterium]MDH4313846.1 MoaD/ThiS family protein [Gammaproteobacteria bacterium]MDH5213676.1 MoaD/ThiS family protein [Gammaproteobacteria bacterium]MDH5500890.1 MoaD/ThiS family protein [Gammaproteobacteria bacterium]